MNRCNVDGDNYIDLSTLRKAEKIKVFVTRANKNKVKTIKNNNLEKYLSIATDFYGFREKIRFGYFLPL